MVFGRLFSWLETAEFSHCDLVTVLSLVESAVIAFLGASDGVTHAALGMPATTLTAACVASCIVDCAATWVACTVGLTHHTNLRFFNHLIFKNNFLWSIIVLIIIHI
jgi:hypothetical protein